MSFITKFTLVSLQLAILLSIAWLGDVNAQSIFTSAASNNPVSPGTELYINSPTTIQKIKPTPTPIAIPPPANPTVISLMVASGVFLVIVVIIGIWINRRRIFHKDQ